MRGGPCGEVGLDLFGGGKAQGVQDRGTDVNDASSHHPPGEKERSQVLCQRRLLLRGLAALRPANRDGDVLRQDPPAGKAGSVPSRPPPRLCQLQTQVGCSTDGTHHPPAADAQDWMSTGCLCRTVTVKGRGFSASPWMQSMVRFSAGLAWKEHWWRRMAVKRKS